MVSAYMDKLRRRRYQIRPAEPQHEMIEMNSANFKAELEFDSDFEKLEQWTVSDSDSNEPDKTTCFVSKEDQKITCFAKEKREITPYYIMQSINSIWREDTRPPSPITGFEFDVETEQKIRRTVLQAIRSVLNTFATDDEAEYNSTTGEILKVRRVSFLLGANCQFGGLLPSTSFLDRFAPNNSAMKTNQYPQFALGTSQLSLLNIHPRYSSNQPPKIETISSELFGHLQFEFWGNREVFWCQSATYEFEECDETVLEKRFNCFMSAFAKHLNIPLNYNNIHVDSTSQKLLKDPNTSNSQFEYDDLYGLAVFLLFFFIPIVSISIFYIIPEKINTCPLDATKFAENSKIRELSRQIEQVDDVEKS